MHIKQVSTATLEAPDGRGAGVNQPIQRPVHSSGVPRLNVKCLRGADVGRGCRMGGGRAAFISMEMNPSGRRGSRAGGRRRVSLEGFFYWAAGGGTSAGEGGDEDRRCQEPGGASPSAAPGPAPAPPLLPRPRISMRAAEGRRPGAEAVGSPREGIVGRARLRGGPSARCQCITCSSGPSPGQRGAGD